jgi:hypothetical protein
MEHDAMTHQTPTDRNGQARQHEQPATEDTSTRCSRRSFLKLAGITGGALLVGAGVDAFAIEPRWLDRTNPSVALPRWPAEWAGLRIAVITDIHVGPLMDLDDAREAVDSANTARPDLIVLLGDYISQADAVTGPLVQLFRNLRAPLGVFAVLGNHDYWADAPAVIRSFHDAGVRILTNDHVILNRNGAELCLAGVDDLMAGRPDLAAALRGVPQDMPRLLLCHNPDYLDTMPHDLRVDLALCGHTHGGQVRLPLLGPPILPVDNRDYAEGLVQAPSCPAYISRGIGMVSIPVRFNCRPELPVITLTTS